MKNNENGEFELVLGNRQLLSGFFIVALLFGVAFAMGYIVGRNSTPSQKLQAEAATGTAAPAPETRPEPTPAAAPPAEQTPPPHSDASADQPASDAPAQPTTQPAKDGPAAPPPEAAASDNPAEPPSGTYWQAISVAQPQAEMIGKALKDKGLPVLLAPGSKNLTRVLVGPYADTQALGRAKSQLENAGFHPIILKK